jgi:uncharacterized membrane protein
MLNEKRVKHMVKLASYEEKGGTEDIKISSYFKKDYVSFNVLVSLLWVTLGYVSLVALVCFSIMQNLVENMSFRNMILLIATIVAVYVFLLLVYGVGAVRFYKKRHQAAKHGVKKYIRDLEVLEKMYEREDA